MFKQKNKILSFVLLFSLFLGNFSFIILDLKQTFANTKQDLISKENLTKSSPDKNKLNNLAKYNGIIIKFKDSKFNLKTTQSVQSVKTLALSKGLQMTDFLADKNISSFKLEDKTISVDKLINNLKKEDYVDFVQPNYLYYTNTISSNDTDKDKLWALDNYGQKIESQTGTIGSDMSWNKASTIFSGTTNVSNTGVVVAVLDSGVAYNHPDLINQMWDGTNCKNENGAYIGNCLHGYDFADNDKDPNAEIGTHGTHVAGIIAAQMNNGNGIIGVNPNAKIMALRMGDSSFSTLSIIKSIYFAKNNQAKIINASFGSAGVYAFDELQYLAIKDFTNSGGLFIVAAGNDSGNNDDINDRFFPASFGVNNYTDSDGFLTGTTSGSGIYTFTGLTNLISVAATDNQDNKASFSNYGANTVNIGAPGVSIYSSILGDVSAFSGANILNFTTGGINNNWGNLSNTGILRTDLSYPYATGADTYVEKRLDLSSLHNPTLKFGIWCDAGSSSPNFDDYTTDYASLSFSTGGSFLDYAKYNYTSLSLVNYTDPGYYANFEIPLDIYKSSNFKFRFSWHTDGVEDTDNGCFFYDVSVDGTDNGLNNEYRFFDGTSMASPQVAGLASLVWSYKPNLQASTIKSAILNNGDSISSLSGITTTGKRINAFKTLLSLTDIGAITQLKAYSDSGKTSEISSGSIISNPDMYLEWQDSTNPGALEKYKLEIKDFSGNLLETDYFSGNILNTGNHILGLNLLSNSYSGSYLKYSIIPILYDGREGQALELNFVYDNIAPIFSYLNYNDNTQVSSTSINFTGSVYDLNLSGSLLINGTGVSLSSSGYFSKTIDLSPGLNNINLSVTDKVGNTTSTGINLIRIGTAPIVYSSISSGSIKLEFNSDFTSTGVFIYGTGGNLDNISTGSYLDYHNIYIPYINSEETYYYKAYYVRDGYNSILSDTGTIKTPKFIDLSINTGSIVNTGSINIFNSSSTGVIIGGTGSIKLFDDTGLNYIEIGRNLEINTSSGTWDGLIQAPHNVSSTGTISLSGYTRILDKTFKIGSDSDSLNFSGGTVFVSLDVGNSYSGKTLKVYRSDDNQNSFTYISDCVVSSNKCSFYTNSFSEFALVGQNALDSTPDNFVFNSVSSAELNTQYTSNTITVTGINTSTGITASAGTLIINGSDSGTSGAVSSGTIVAVKLSSSSSYSSRVSSTITIGGVSSTYTITTKAATVSSGGGGGGGGGGSYTPTCIDSNLVCTNGIYYRKSGISCNDGNLGKACTSSGITSTGNTSDMIVDSNLKNLIDTVNNNPSLNKTYSIQTNSVNLKDLANHFSKKYVDELVSRGVIQGYDDDTFRPDNAITRAEYLSILIKSLGISVDKSLTKSSFTDIEDGSWIVKYSELAKTSFDISANTNKFRPNDFITRAEALAMLFKISKLNLQTSSTNIFADSDLETWMSKYTTKAKSLGLVKGQEIDGKTYFKPNSNITRGETTKIIVNLLKIMGK